MVLQELQTENIAYCSATVKLFKSRNCCWYQHEDFILYFWKTYVFGLLTLTPSHLGLNIWPFGLNIQAPQSRDIFLVNSP